MRAGLSAPALRAALRTEILGRNLHVVDRTESTNRDALAAARQGAPEGTLIVAEEQTAGRGRMGRRWLAPHGTSLLFSLLFRPEERPAELGMAVALGAGEGIGRFCGLEVGLKWPNDLMVGGSKVGGVLLEVREEACVVGCGINVNWDPTELPELAGASSLAREAGRAIDRAGLLATVLEATEGWYGRWRQGTLVPLWREALQTLGRPVLVLEGAARWEGRAVDVDAGGGLVVETADGARRTVYGGEASLRERRL